MDTVRASDAERERVADALRHHFATGRLETHELEERVAAAHAARWRHELRALTRDLPFEPPITRARVARGVDTLQRGLLHLHFVCWVIFNTVLLAIWAWGGGHGAWPLAATIPTTLLLAWHARGSRALSRRLTPGDDPLPRRRLLV